MNRTCALTVILLSLAVSLPSSAEGEIELGGRTSVTGKLGLGTANPDKLHTEHLVQFEATLSRFTEDARFEYGIGLSVAGIPKDAGDITIVTPFAEVRANSDLIGPRKNILVYLGFVAGASWLKVDVDGEKDLEDKAGAFGPRFGAEYYFSSNFAVQLDDTALFDTDQGLTNNLTFGVKYLF